MPVLKIQQQRLDQLTNRSLLVIKITHICKGELASDRRTRNGPSPPFKNHCFPRFGVTLRPTNTFHPHSKSDYIWVHKRTARTGQGSGTSFFSRRNCDLTHVHIYTTAWARARTKYPKLDCLVSSACKTTARLSRDNGLYVFILLVSLRVESVHIKAPPFGKDQSLLKNYPEMPPQPTPQAAEGSSPKYF